MIKTLTIFSLSFLLISCKNEEIRKNTELKLHQKEVAIDTTNGEQFIAILKLKNSKTPVNLAKEDFKIIEVLLRKSVQDYNIGKEKIIDLRYYKRQYSPYIDENGDKLVGINCFCSISGTDNWKTESVFVKDGGKCFFQARINLSRKEVEFFQTNGEGG